MLSLVTFVLIAGAFTTAALFFTSSYSEDEAKRLEALQKQRESRLIRLCLGGLILILLIGMIVYCFGK